MSLVFYVRSHRDQDVGFGSLDNGRTRAQVFEKAKKQGVSDALKRSMRSFGNLLGNCIYDKEYLADLPRVKLPPSVSFPVIKTILVILYHVLIDASR